MYVQKKKYMVQLAQYSFVQIILHTRLVWIKKKKKYSYDSNLFQFSNILQFLHTISKRDTKSKIKQSSTLSVSK